MTETSMLDGSGSSFRRRRNRWNSFYLEDGDEFRPESILYCFHYWRFGEAEREMCDFITRRGGQYCHVDQLRPSLGYVLVDQLVRQGLGSLPRVLRAL